MQSEKHSNAHICEPPLCRPGHCWLTRQRGLRSAARSRARRAHAGAIARTAALGGPAWLRILAVFVVLGGALFVLRQDTNAVHDDGFQLEGNVDAADLDYVDIDASGGGGTETPGMLAGAFAGPYDWYDSAGGDGIFDGSGNPIDQTAAGFVDSDFVVDFRTAAGVFDPSDPSTFTGGGSKDINEISSWRCVEANNVTNKGDIINAYATLREVGGQRILYFGIEKQEGNGDNNVGLWLLQDPNVGCQEGGSGNGNAFTGQHMDHDLFLVAEVTNGGGVASIVVYEWLSGALTATGTTGVDCLDTSAGDSVCAVTNGEPITVPWPHVGAGGAVGADYEKVSFLEGGINLSDFPDFANACFTGFLFNTRSSQETTATLYDYALGDIDTCNPELSLEKTPDSGTHFVGDSFDWTIEVTNNGDGPADDAVVTDTIPDGLTINSAEVEAPGVGTCDVTGQDVECTIDVPVGDTITITVNVTATGDAVTDESGCSTLDNTATVTVDGDTDSSDDSDDGHITICELQVSKTAETSYDLEYDWTIVKNVSPETLDMFEGDTGTVEWEIIVSKDDGTASNFAVTGTITIHNPADIVATIDDVTDELSIDGAANVDCGVTLPYDLAAGADLICTYDAAATDDSDQENEATATLANSPDGETDFSGTADVDFSTATINYIDETATVSDTNGASLGAVSDDHTFTYTETFSCDSDEGSHNNVATIVEDDTDESHNDDATATVNCYDLVVTKDASTSYDLAYDWTIEKTVDPTTLDMFTGDSADVTWTVTVNRDDGTKSNFAVSGNITVSNLGNPIAATINSVSDSLSLTGGATVDCGVTFPYTLAAGGTLNCTYDAAPTDDSEQLNTATARLQNYDYDEEGVGTPSGTKDYTGTAAVDFTSATVTEIDESATASDTNGQDFGTVVDGDVFNYDETFTCDADEGTHDNLATLVEGDTGTERTDDASVTVNCYALVVTKDATTTFTRTWEWDIDKSVTPDTWDLFTGETGTSEYTVTVTKTGSTDSDWAVTGNIHVNNPAPIDATLNSVSDVVSGAITGTVDCGVAFPYTLVAGATLDCTYSADLPDGSDRTNTATATIQNTPSGTTDFTGNANVTFGDPTTVINDTINVDDTYAGDLGSFSDSGSTTYTRDFTCDGDEGTHGNTATIVETGQSDSASVTVTCYDIAVTKDADTTFTRTWTWTIDKTGDQTELTLAPDQIFIVNYEVTVNATSQDSDWAVSGNITINNPHPTRAAELTNVVDSLTGGISGTVDCGGVTEVPAGGQIVCTYTADLPDATSRTNTATATQQLYNFDKDLNATADGTSDESGTANVTFGAPTTEIDECINVTDTYAGDLGTVCANEVPKTFTYSREIGPFGTCGEHTVDNTAAFETNDTSTTGSDDHQVVVTIPCPEGCTLTQGYWKTHSSYGPAPEDITWNDLYDADLDLLLEGPDEDFFLSGQTWYEVFWTAPQGNAYYILAHQYMAAVLNGIAGADQSTITQTLLDAEALFEAYTPDDIAALKGKNGKELRQQFIDLAGILGAYNEGDIGPGHCDEDATSSIEP